MASNSNLRTRVEQLEQRQIPTGGVRLIAIVAMGDSEAQPRLVWRHGHAHFEGVGAGTTLDDFGAFVAS